MKNLINYINNVEIIENNKYFIKTNKEYNFHNPYTKQENGVIKYRRRKSKYKPYYGGLVFGKVLFPCWKDVDKNNKQWEEKNIKVKYFKQNNNINKNVYFVRFFVKANKHTNSFNQHFDDIGEIIIKDVEITESNMVEVLYCDNCGENIFSVYNNKYLLECSNCGKKYKSNDLLIKDENKILLIKRKYKLKMLNL